MGSEVREVHGDEGGLGAEPDGGGPAGLAGEVAVGVGVEVVPEVFSGVGGGDEAGEQDAQ
jgi:hypothetical protein